MVRKTEMKLYCAHFNFCRGHGGLRYKDERGIECKNTPEREAGIIESKWTLKELLTFRCFKISIGLRGIIICKFFYLTFLFLKQSHC